MAVERIECELVRIVGLCAGECRFFAETIKRHECCAAECPPDNVALITIEALGCRKNAGDLRQRGQSGAEEVRGKNCNRGRVTVDKANPAVDDFVVIAPHGRIRQVKHRTAQFGKRRVILHVRLIGVAQFNAPEHA